ncbi:periplasmic heavy metal sensor [Noviherbaspirillum sp. UKPF54]|uniref:periplasmic heavy metal sensor n=1 Tax=Noviherbaspirillum sp. UKPF54 TaxID=2601898 RepID=UPI0011B12837|nr:periplasmic heavy metal sensor [Noviherbaspirillum sp. UKPF54]QDZ30329.1 periplasmic heavy metal sensor [Noviherbaspirillum sp. UKPF54]
MNRSALKLLLAVSLALNAGIVATVGVSRLGAMSQPAAPQSARVSLPDYLELNAEQRRRWSDMEQGFLKDLAANWREIKVHRETLIRQAFSAAPDHVALDAEQVRIAALQDSQQRRVMRQLLAERDLLNPHQREKLMTLFLSRYAQETTEEEMLHRH